MVALPTEAAEVEAKLRVEANRIRFRTALGLSTRVRNVAEFGIVPTAVPPTQYRVQAVDGTWSFTGQAGNNTAALINAAYQKAFTEGFSLSFDNEPGKYYYLESPLLCFKSNGTTFQTVDLPALIGNTGFQSYASEQAVQFMATHAGPCIITQGGRGFTVKNIWCRTFLGGSYAQYAASGFSSATTAQRFNDHTLWNGSVFSHSRYAPSCGIAIDPFSSSVPSDDRYSGLSGLSSLATYYSHTSSFSSATVIENCTFAYNRIGVVVGLGVGQNSDGVTIRGCKFSSLKYCVVVSHAQTKNITIERPSIAVVWAVVANGVHGAQNGIWPSIVNPDNCSYIGNIYGGEGLTVPIHPMYMVSFDGMGSNWEDIGRIGYFGGPNGVNGPVNIKNVQIGFVETGNPHLTSGRETTVQSCKFILNASATDKFRIESECIDALPAGWDTGYQGRVRGSEMIFNDCGFSVSGSSASTLGGLINLGSSSTGIKNWIKFNNCKGYVGDFTNVYQEKINNIRGGALA